jgi:hypothetical protein
MVPFTIFQRLSVLGRGGGANAGTVPSRFDNEDWRQWCAEPCFLSTYVVIGAAGCNRDRSHFAEIVSRIVAASSVLKRMFLDDMWTEFRDLNGFAAKRRQ